jgi:hypothetical protein
MSYTAAAQSAVLTRSTDPTGPSGSGTGAGPTCATSEPAGEGSGELARDGATPARCGIRLWGTTSGVLGLYGRGSLSRVRWLRWLASGMAGTLPATIEAEHSSGEVRGECFGDVSRGFFGGVRTRRQRRS